ncbi:MAG: hypothetical protein JNM85_10370 [Chthonomonas sp.]|nr:hypothetical protein [Chthonomonas sp.]
MALYLIGAATFYVVMSKSAVDHEDTQLTHPAAPTITWVPGGKLFKVVEGGASASAEQAA